VVEFLYTIAVNSVMSVKAVLLFMVAMIVLQSDYFSHRRKWKIGFLVSAGLTFLGVTGDILDGTSTLGELRTWSLLRHLGITSLLFCALGMHWDKFAPILFDGSKIFDNKFMRKLLRYEHD